MKKFVYALLTFLFISITFSKITAQVIRFDKTNKASIKWSGTDTLKMPYTGGWEAPQFSNIDLDGDNVLDLFVFDRIGDKVFCFLRKNNTWVQAPEYEAQFPKLYMWALLRDYNGDGKPDIFTEVDFNAQPDPGKYISNNGLRVLKNVSKTSGKLEWFQEKNQIMDVGLGILPPNNINISNADISAFEDFDGDGDLDILQSPPGKNVFTYYQNLSKEENLSPDSLKYIFRDECWGYASYKVNEHGFVLNDNSPCYRNYKHGGKHNGVTLAVFDPDGDGDREIIYGDLGFRELIYLTNGKTINKLGRDSIIAQDSFYPKNTRRAANFVFPAAYLVDINGDNRRDLVVAPNANAGSKNRDMVMSYLNTSGNTFQFSFQQTDFLVGQMLDLGGGAIPNLVDLDQDGDKDLVMATQGDFDYTNNSYDRLVYFENTGSASKASFVLRDTNFLKINDVTEKIVRISTSFGDLNGDGKADLLIGDINGKLHFYQNQSVGNNISFTKQSGDYFTIYGGTFATPQVIDLNKDGKQDIIIGRKNGTLSYFENKGTATVASFTSEPTIDSIGKIAVGERIISGGMPFYFDGYAKPHICDLDNDGNFEILVGAQTGRVHLFRNFDASATRVCEEINNIYSDFPTGTPNNMSFGPKSSPFVGDLDNDGKPELLIGNARGGIQMYTPTINGIISSLKELSANKLAATIFPNPSSGEFTLRSDRNLKNIDYKIYNLNGSEVGSGVFVGYENELKLNLDKGLYFLSAADGESHLSAKIVIQ
jgi:hypothetical protein